MLHNTPSDLHNHNVVIATSLLESVATKINKKNTPFQGKKRKKVSYIDIVFKVWSRSKSNEKNISAE